MHVRAVSINGLYVARIAERATTSNGFWRFDFYGSSTVIDFAIRIALARNSVYSMKEGTFRNFIEVK